MDLPRFPRHLDGNSPECEIWPATSTRPELPVASARVNDPQISLTRRKWNGENDQGFIGLQRQNLDQAGDLCGRKVKKPFSFTGKRQIFSSRHLSEIAVITRNSHFVRAFAGDSAVLQMEPAGGTAVPPQRGVPLQSKRPTQVSSFHSTEHWKLPLRSKRTMKRHSNPVFLEPRPNYEDEYLGAV